MNHEDNPKSIKYYVKRFLLVNKDSFKNKTVVDFPAGNGVTSAILRDLGAIPLAFDLFPEYFKIEGLNCEKADISKGIPLEDNMADALICQEGIEHFSDQLAALKEFNRIMKKKGTLLITTPNYSSIRSKLSYLLSESESYNKKLAPNELDSIWMSNQDISGEVYYGHIFLIGIQKLRVLAALSGFRLKKCHPTMKKSTSRILLPFYYPFIVISNKIAYNKRMKRNKDFDESIKTEIYGEIYKLSVNPSILVCGNLMVEFEKEKEIHEVGMFLKSKHKEFGLT